jgi:hypothetical protein
LRRRKKLFVEGKREEEDDFGSKYEQTPVPSAESFQLHV